MRNKTWSHFGNCIIRSHVLEGDTAWSKRYSFFRLLFYDNSSILFSHQDCHVRWLDSQVHFCVTEGFVLDEVAPEHVSLRGLHTWPGNSRKFSLLPCLLCILVHHSVLQYPAKWKKVRTTEICLMPLPKTSGALVWCSDSSKLENITIHRI